MTAAEAKEYVLSRVLEEAALQGVSFTAFETKLLRDSADQPGASEEEINNFDEEHGEELWERVGDLIRRSLARERRERGFGAWTQYRGALKLAAANGDYFAGILIVGQFAPLFRQSSRGHLVTIAAGTVLGLLIVAAALASALYGDRFSRWLDSSWIARTLDQHGGVAFFGGFLLVVVYSGWSWWRIRRT